MTKITLNRTLQFLAFSIATLLATGLLVLGGLNERGLVKFCETIVACA